ncbi:PASTA domain-containing protein [Bifidobacterium sp. ESL0763]|uniref:Stk1 family PASTA domain-containing Ser/Thr kinase n=1 Tax=Bifidobacterium sp. ESL0763 TaxID=2983227 RepID=UPI0023F69C89|nr:Stk1 family PASTA domain-containing Ser/Thr kinase [Bifidobacterium sp. ESL0763]MDF7664070.1 PASTA domain-containing protein [Bifidobacterium sp. ESL0763]
MSQTDQTPTIEGRYRVLAKIADGGMATVYQAMDERLERTVAIKVMHTQLAEGPHRDQFVERFHREARSAAAISNPHIVQVYDTGTWHNLDFLVMEYVHGVNLRHEMEERGALSVRETVRIVSQTLDGLSAAHQAGVVHRDIKPENILLNDRGRVQITDFGLAKAVSQATLSTTGMLLGTAAYLAPEIIENNEATPQGDLYSVGIMAWEMLAGQVPFASGNPVTMVFKHVHEDVPPISSVCPGIDPTIDAFVASLTQRDISARPADATVAWRQLKTLSAGLDGKAWSFRRAAATAAATAAGLAGTQSGTPAAATALDDRTRPQVPAPPRQTTAATTALPGTPSTQPGATDLAGTTNTAPSPTAARYREPGMPSASNAATQAINGRTLANDGSKAAGEPTTTLPPLDARMAQAEPTADKAKSSTGTGTTTSASAPAAKRANRQPIVIAALAAAFVLLAALGGAWWYFWGPGSYWNVPKPDQLSCPSQGSCRIADVRWSPYESTLKVAGVPYQVRRDYSDTVKAGNIISTDPGSVGSHVSKRRSGKLRVVVSRGVRQATVPKDILDPKSADGRKPLAALKKAGFTKVVHRQGADEYSETLPAGAVQSITPKPGARVAHNHKVVVVLSKGPMPVSMPDIVGRSRQEAQVALDDAKLKANYTEQFSDTVDAGVIVSSSIKAGTQLHWGDSVDIVVSKGPETVTIPDVRGKGSGEAQRMLEALGLKVKISAPLGDLTHTVRLQSPDPGQQVRVRDANGNPTVVTLTVV